MKIIKPSVEILTEVNGEEILKHIEKIGRVCYKSEDKITDESAKEFVANIIKRGHEAVIEHFNISVKFICDRGVSHEIVRHRIASYAQESTRYCNYSKDKFDNQITFIQPCWFMYDYTIYSPSKLEDRLLKKDLVFDDVETNWLTIMSQSEKSYKQLIEYGWSAQEARSVLPNSLKTEIVVTMNLREWRHFFKLRTAKVAHPQMREVAIMLLEQLKEKLPVIFDDITIQKGNN